MSIRILRHHVQLPILLLFCAEAVFAVLALALVTTEWLQAAGQGLPLNWSTYGFFSAVYVLAGTAMGLYNPRLREHLLGLALRLALVAAAVFLVMDVGIRAFPNTYLDTGEVAQALVLTVAAALATRYVLLHTLTNGFLKTRVLVYGAGRQAASIASLRRRSDRMGFVVDGYLPAEGEARSVPGELLIDAGDDLPGYCERHAVDEIVVAMDDRRQAFPLRELLQCRIRGIDVLELVGFLERETGAVRLDVLNPSWMIFSEGFRRSALRDFVGRLLDLAVVVILLALLWPLIVLIALAIKLEDGWRAPVLYRQARVGKDGTVFDLYKFRSMRQDAEADGVARWASDADERVTRVGALIRRLRLDELPQLWNVLRGDMRFVGPRPERPEFVSEFAENLPYYAERHCVPPGLTGWAQVCYPYGSSEQDAIEKLKYDLYYIKNRSFLFDLAILVQTVEVIVFGKGAR